MPTDHFKTVVSDLVVGSEDAAVLERPNTRSRGTLWRGKKWGLWESIDDVGHLYEAVEYELSQCTGVHVLFDWWGRPRTIGRMINSRVDGGEFTFGSRGEPIEEGGCANGKRVGVWRRFLWSRGKTLVLDYGAEGESEAKPIASSDGLPSFGEVQHSDQPLPSPGARAQQVFRATRTLNPSFDHPDWISGKAEIVIDGEKVEICGMLHKDEKEGVWESRSDDGVVTTCIPFCSGQRQGVSLEFFDNGRPKRLCRYDRDVLNGPFFEWTAEGTLSLEGVVRGGKRVGQWRATIGSDAHVTVTDYGLDGRKAETWREPIPRWSEPDPRLVLKRVEPLRKKR